MEQSQFFSDFLTLIHIGDIIEKEFHGEIKMVNNQLTITKSKVDEQKYILYHRYMIHVIKKFKEQYDIVNNDYYNKLQQISNNKSAFDSSNEKEKFIELETALDKYFFGEDARKSKKELKNYEPMELKICMHYIRFIHNRNLECKLLLQNEYFKDTKSEKGSDELLQFGEVSLGYNYMGTTEFEWMKRSLNPKAHYFDDLKKMLTIKENIQTGKAQWNDLQAINNQSKWIHIYGPSSTGKTFFIEILKRRLVGTLFIFVRSLSNAYKSGTPTALKSLFESLSKFNSCICFIDEFDEEFKDKQVVNLFKQYTGQERFPIIVITTANAMIFEDELEKKFNNNNIVITDKIESEALAARCGQVPAFLTNGDIEQFLNGSFKDYIKKGETIDTISDDWIRVRIKAFKNQILAINGIIQKKSLESNKNKLEERKQERNTKKLRPLSTVEEESISKFPRTLNLRMVNSLFIQARLSFLYTRFDKFEKYDIGCLLCQIMSSQFGRIILKNIGKDEIDDEDSENLSIPLNKNIEQMAESEKFIRDIVDIESLDSIEKTNENISGLLKTGKCKTIQIN